MGLSLGPVTIIKSQSHKNPNHLAFLSGWVWSFHYIHDRNNLVLQKLYLNFVYFLWVSHLLFRRRTFFTVIMLKGAHTKMKNRKAHGPKYPRQYRKTKTSLHHFCHTQYFITIFLILKDIHFYYKCIAMDDTCNYFI